MTPIASRDLWIRDAYGAWRRNVAAAQSSITIFSPYLGELVRKLLKHASLEPGQITIVTDLSPRSGVTEYLPQLRTLRRLLNDGVEVRALERLHAKVLMVDDDVITLGSQNFTTYARSSREATAAPSGSLKDTPTVRTLRSWRERATPVTTELIDELIAKLEADAVALQKQALALEEKFNDAQAAFLEAEKRRREEVLRAERLVQQQSRMRAAQVFDRLTRQSRIQMAQRTAWATMDYSSGYWSLKADAEYDLTNWISTDATERQSVALARLRMVPVLLLDSQRMAFARVGKKVITYVRTGVREPTRVTVRGKSCEVVVRFPLERTWERNIEVQFTPYGRGLDCVIELHFDGARLRVRDARAASEAPRAPDFDAFLRACTGFMRRHDGQAEILKLSFTGFRFKELGVANQNAKTFFTGHRYKLGLIELHSVPILLATNAW